MENAAPTHDSSIARLGTWLFLMPVFAVWPFLSAMPLIKLAAGDATPITIALQISLFVTGFWAFLGMWILAEVARPVDALRPYMSQQSGRVLAIGLYALVWIFFDTIVAFASR